MKHRGTSTQHREVAFGYEGFSGMGGGAMRWLWATEKKQGVLIGAVLVHLPRMASRELEL